MPDLTAARPVSGQPIETVWGQQVHDVVEGIQSGFVSLTGITNAVDGTAVITFPRPYSVTPTILVLCGSQQVTAGWSGQSPTGFTARARRNDNSGSATTQSVQWVAIGPLA